MNWKLALKTRSGWKVVLAGVTGWGLMTGSVTGETYTYDGVAPVTSDWSADTEWSAPPVSAVTTDLIIGAGRKTLSPHAGTSPCPQSSGSAQT